ncbi:response regulator transcription factor [Gimesia fumaroli]|uniref:Alkaline phosphatase synthesis transcriptional regulatory protein PhoP n=1 Tax=Gimesia fumaroli TaxID=2527976 RepID=A0A518I6Q4_9PLAN|nr:response regulator [Gimesia fumaroli]QDV48750.1 Alkaline phosphatase synthesis transcriptional regulatory protein PhoP [Gimesia fumaroli]
MATNELRRDMTRSIVNHILVVEDEQDTALFLRTLLEEHGYHVTIAKDGGQAHSSFSMHKPDFVILDLILPHESGFEICEHMKQRECHVPILILTAIDSPESRQLATRVGADGYLLKPCNPDELLELIKEISNDLWEQEHLPPEKVKTEERIHFFCPCGKKLKVRIKHRGRTMTCPACHESLMVPLHD